jgi:fructan beta-fructosidase
MSLAGYGYHIGSFDGNRFLAESEYIPADYGYSWQAAYSYNNLPDRRIWLAFMRDAGKGPTYPWRNNMSIPRKLELKTCKAGIRMIQKPIKELEQLRKNHSSFRDTYLNSSINVLKDLNKDIFEIDAEFCIEKPVEFGFKLRKGNGVETIIKYLPESGMAVVDIINASDPKYDKCAGSLGHHFFDLQFPIRVFSRCYQAYYRGEGNNLSIRIFVDVSSIETFFGNGEVVFSNSIYPPPDCKGMELYALGDGIRLSRCDIYDLESIWRG